MSKPPWNHNIHYHRLVLRAMRRPCGRALDVGCGQGLLTRKLASQTDHVTGIDLDGNALAYAVAASDADGRIDYVHGDAMLHPFADESFDFIVAVATLHHLPLEPALTRFKASLKPGGVLAVIGLFRSESALDYAVAAVAIPASFILRALRGHADVGAPVRDPDETFAEIRAATRAILPGAILRIRLLFRYALVWRKPEMALP
jgi:2-polyprenyl-3-methyl-5-hydroxy-6-metoxy-1,4-benzoquinol methylase